ncbi:hypothetical protein OGH69_09230 [Flavobacterium sp. MFBS3-15]|uniref:hypothetical protein n=1 Tax=Flavobacterium sp. MFBS3-15 TaxID=2989816 RepID=UPI002235E2B9|nr:hypothetical protein [Flavobacterium sp. MFBS3-15]MCW4469145.1 hypothetical protein [Flavobacterium sp. MFBS3-15]
MSALKNFFSDRTNLIGLVLALVGAFMLLSPIFQIPLGPLPAEEYMFSSVDASWVIALNHAKNIGVTWGEDFNFTYGPLFYLATRFGWGCSKYAFIAYDIFYFLNLFAVFFITYKKSPDKLLAAFIIVAVVLITPARIGGVNALVWSLLLIFWLRQNMEKPNWVYYLLQSLILCMLFLIKLNTGLTSFVFYYASLSYIFFFRKDNRIRVILYALLPVVLSVILAQVLNISLKGYLVSAVNMVSGHNEIMYLEDPLIGQMTLLAVFFMLLLTGAVAYRLLWKKGIFSHWDELYKGLVILFLCSAGLFVIYKQGFVRADLGHMLEFFKCATLMILCICVFQGGERKKWGLPVALLLFVPVAYAGVKLGQGNFFAFENKWNKSGYFKGMADFTPESGLLIHPNNNQIPSTVKSKIGNSTVDMYPWNAYMLLENKLNYSPRPVMQTYVSYTKYLEDLNFAHYNSDKAPEFVLYAYPELNVDDRYLLFDEPKIHLAFLKNYIQVDAFDLHGTRFLVLQKKKDAKPVQLELVKEYAMLLDSPIVPKEGVYYEVELYKNLGAKIEGILTHAPAVKLEIRDMTNGKKDYKTSVPLLQTGIFCTRHIQSTQDFEGLMKKDTVDKIKQVKYYKIRPTGDDFKDKIRVREYTIK